MNFCYFSQSVMPFDFGVFYIHIYLFYFNFIFICQYHFASIFYFLFLSAGIAYQKTNKKTIILSSG